MHGLGHRARSIALLRLTALCLAASKAALAQAPQPFLPAVSTPHFALVSEFAAVDVNRDGSADMLSPGLFFGTQLSTLDEYGQTIVQSTVNVAVAPTPRSSLVPRPLTIVAADLDLDGAAESGGQKRKHATMYQDTHPRCSVQPSPARP